MRITRRAFSALGASFVTAPSVSRLGALAAVQTPAQSIERDHIQPRPEEAEPAGGLRWTFDRWGDLSGWTVPEVYTGAVMGGSLWLTAPAIPGADIAERAHVQIYGDRRTLRGKTPLWIESPPNLAFSASQFSKVKLRILNLSPSTDGYVSWKSSPASAQPSGMMRFAMRPALNEWQDVICHVDGRWTGRIDQIGLWFFLASLQGNIWIQSIEITAGSPLVPQVPPDLSSSAVTPRIHLPGIAQQDFEDAFRVLQECLVTNVPVFGFNYPVTSAGGHYGENWWQLDSSLAVIGAKWANLGFCENVMRGFQEVQAQNPDGRIDLYGRSAIRGQAGDVSSLPRFFEAAYDVARRTKDLELSRKIYQTMGRYLDWWLSPAKRDGRTGLVTALLEETFSDLCHTPQACAPVDLNVAVAVGCRLTSLVAAQLGEPDTYGAEFDRLSEIINRYLWDEERGGYYNYSLVEKRLVPRLICTTFDPLRMRIAPADRVEKLIPRLLDPRLFNWGRLPVTTIAMTDPDFMEATGRYNAKQWFGDVWAMRNLFILAGLEDSGRHDLAAELAWATIRAFNRSYTEYIVPSTGRGDGVQRYAWSASLYISAIVEHLFGVDFDRAQRRLRIFPRIPSGLRRKRLELSRLIVSEGTRCNLQLEQATSNDARLRLSLDGPLPAENLEVLLPRSDGGPTSVHDAQGRDLPLVRDPGGLKDAVGVRIPMARSVELRFS